MGEKKIIINLRISQSAMPQEERTWRCGHDSNHKLRKSFLLRPTLDPLDEDVLSKINRKAPALVTAAIPVADSTI